MPEKDGKLDVSTIPVGGPYPESTELEELGEAEPELAVESERRTGFDARQSAGERIIGGDISHPTDVINRFAIRAAGDDDSHGFQMANACFIRRTSACNCRASCLRSGFPSRN